MARAAPDSEIRRVIRPAEGSRRYVVDVEFYVDPREPAPHTERVAGAHLAGESRPGVAVSRPVADVLDLMDWAPSRVRWRATHEARFTHRILP